VTDIRVQSPVIGSALRDALNLAAAGGMPLWASDTIIPVAVVANVQDAVQQNRIDGYQLAYSPAVVGSYSFCALEWQAPPAVQYDTEFVQIEGVHLNSSNSTRVYFALSPAVAITPGVGLAQVKRSSQLGSALACRVGYGATATAPTTFLPRAAAITVLQSNVDLYYKFDRPLVLDLAATALVAITSGTNADLYASFEWSEFRRP